MKFQMGPLQNKWLEALKSGKYDKGKSCLVTSDGEYCCLGVACDILNLEIQDPAGDDQYFIFEKSAKYDLMPGRSWELLGLRSDSGTFLIDNIIDPLRSEIDKIVKPNIRTIYHLSDINDLTDNFSLIIKIIEQFPEAVFTEPK